MKVSPWLVLAIFAFLLQPLSAQESGMAFGNVKILEISGTPARVSKPDGSSAPAKAGEFIREGAVIKTGAGSTVTLLMDNGALVVIQPETEFSIDRFITNPFDYEGIDYKTMTKEPSRVSKPDGSSAPAKAGEFIQEGFTIKTAAGSTVTLLMDNGALVVIQPETEFSIDRFITNPFDYEGIDYKTMTKEPSRSVTKLNVRSGDIFLNVVPLNKESKFDIVTPLGSAGIRGTSLSVGSSGIVVAAGLVQAFSAAGQSQMLGANTGVGLATNGFSALSQQAISAMIQAIINAIQQFRSTLPVDPFAGAPPQTPVGGGGDEESDTGDQGTINAGQTLPGSGNRPPLPSN